MDAWKKVCAAGLADRMRSDDIQMRGTDERHLTVGRTAYGATQPPRQSQPSR